LERKDDLAKSLLQFSLATKTVFSNKVYLSIAAAIAITFWIFLNTFDQILFFSPVVTFYLPTYATFGFILSDIISALVGIVISMSIYALKHTKSKIGASFFSGPALGVVSGACVSCSPLAFVLASVFGTAGVATSAFLTNYQIPLRLVSIGLLIWAYYSVNRKLAGTCTNRI
jgi:hypothetical protein